MKSDSTMAETEITHGTGNIFADLGYPDADARQKKLRLAHEINMILQAEGSRTTAAAAAVGLNEIEAADLADYRIDGFGLERLAQLKASLEASHES